MLVRRFPYGVLLGAFPFVLAHCSSGEDAGTGTGGTSGATAIAGNAGTAHAGTGGAGPAGSGGTAGKASGGTGAVGGTGPTGGTGAVGGTGPSGGTGAVGGTGPAGGTGASGGAAAGGMSAAGGTGPAGGTGSAGTSGAPQGGSGGAGGSSAFTLRSPDHEDNAAFASAYTCAAMNGMFGSGVNPELNWTGVPAGTMSFAITFIDTKLGEDSAMGQHWAAWDIPASVTQLPEATTMFSGALAGAKQTNKYLSPCPSGDDTYAFTIYALPTATLSVTMAEGTGVANSAGVARVLAALRAATPLGTAVLRGTSGPMGM
jgi:Raf kinase inhibitor-like YbhB/YbcL family protein